MESNPVTETEPKWDRVIQPKRGWFDIPWRDLWKYRDLIWLLAKRDMTATYKQTVMGPFWFIVQPLMTTVVFSFLFGRMARLGTDHIPHFLFYMAGLAPWNFFAECINKTAHSFTRNVQIFGKVYFPRLAMPISAVIVNFTVMMVQMTVLFIGMAIYWVKGVQIDMNWRVLLLPLLVLQMAMLGVGVGCIVSSLTTRFKDLGIGIGFGVQLWMFGSSIVFPLSRIAEQDRWIFSTFNPMVPVVETFRFALLGAGLVERWQVMLSFGISATVFAIGIALFNRAEQTVMDTI